MATSKPDIMIILLSKLMEEGDMFYKVRRVGFGGTKLDRCSLRRNFVWGFLAP